VCSVRCGVSREGHGRDRVSLNYRSFMFGKLPPPACPGLCYTAWVSLCISMYLCFTAAANQRVHLFHSHGFAVSVSCIQPGTSDAVLSCFLASLKDRTMSCTPGHTRQSLLMYLTPSYRYQHLSAINYTACPTWTSTFTVHLWNVCFFKFHLSLSCRAGSTLVTKDVATPLLPIRPHERGGNRKGIGKSFPKASQKHHSWVTSPSTSLHYIYSTVFLAQVKCCTQVWGNMWPMFPNLFDQRGARSLLRSWAERVISARWTRKVSFRSGKDRRVLKMNSIFEKETNSYRFFAAC